MSAVIDRTRALGDAPAAADRAALSVVGAAGTDEAVRKATAELLARSEARRRAASEALGETGARSQNGQFFTPSAAAELLASLPVLAEREEPIRLLDPGAGSGMLSAAFVARWLTEAPGTPLEIVAVERDMTVIPALWETLNDCRETAKSFGSLLTVEILNGDFIDLSASLGQREELLAGYDIVIQNPPYSKLAAGSRQRKLIQSIGADAPNLYAAFLALGASALKPGGQLVAITPRSFCNGPYFGTFRSYLLDRLALDRVHVFESRGKVFADTGVLQENVVFSGTVDGDRSTVTISQSVDHSDEPTMRTVSYSEVVHPGDKQRFIRLTTNDEDTAVADLFASLPAKLTDLGLKCSTGKIVDFRLREQLNDEPQEGSVPLIYPGNLRSGAVEWPREIRKPQWFAPDGENEKTQLVPEGWYCLIKRFSSKEEKRRIVAALWSPEDYPGPAAFENHLNVIHAGGAGLDRELATGLTLWLNSGVVDRFFRTFSGHTQVNATDVKSMRFPSEATLRSLAERASTTSLAQEHLDELVEELLVPETVAA